LTAARAGARSQRRETASLDTEGSHECADETPESLRRIIEFLTSQMSPAEVLGAEVPQYVGKEGIGY